MLINNKAQKMLQRHSTIRRDFHFRTLVTLRRVRVRVRVGLELRLRLVRVRIRAGVRLGLGLG